MVCMLSRPLNLWHSNHCTPLSFYYLKTKWHLKYPLVLLPLSGTPPFLWNSTPVTSFKISRTLIWAECFVIISSLSRSSSHVMGCSHHAPVSCWFIMTWPSRLSQFYCRLQMAVPSPYPNSLIVHLMHGCSCYSISTQTKANYITACSSWNIPHIRWM